MFNLITMVATIVMICNVHSSLTQDVGQNALILYVAMTPVLNFYAKHVKMKYRAAASWSNLK